MTEVKHGPNPKFSSQITGDPFGLTIVGHYTTTPDLDAGGVTTHQYASDRDEKRRAELLGMRTIFLHWWLSEWRARGGTLEDGLARVIRVAQDTVEKIAAGTA